MGSILLVVLFCLLGLCWRAGFCVLPGQSYCCMRAGGLHFSVVLWSRLLGVFFGREFPSDLVTFPMYTAVLLVMNASILRMLQSMPLTSMFLMCFSLTCFQLITRILWVAPWWKLDSLLKFRLVRFQVLQPHSSAFSSPATYICGYLSFYLHPCCQRRIFLPPLGTTLFNPGFDFCIFI